MEPFSSITERSTGFCPDAPPQVARRRSRAPLYASPWIALYAILRRELRQSRLLSN